MEALIEGLIGGADGSVTTHRQKNRAVTPEPFAATDRA
jgi:hypothetical protein